MNADELIERPHDGSHLTRAQTRSIERYAARLQAKLGLSHWRVWVARDLPPEGASMMIEPTDGRRVAMLYVSEGWWDKSAADKRLEMVHEILHLAHHEPDHIVRTEMPEDWPFYNLFHANLERMVDGLAFAIAPLLPAWRP